MEPSVSGLGLHFGLRRVILALTPVQPFCFQTRGIGPSEFVITKTFQDGLIMLRDIYMRTRSETRFEFVQLLEHSWGNERVCRLLIDWEMEESKFGSKFSVDEVKEMAANFPRWFASRLREMRAVNTRSEIKIIMKNKSRTTDSGYKVSYHFVVNVVGVPAGSHKQVCQRIFEVSVR